MKRNYGKGEAFEHATIYDNIHEEFREMLPKLIRLAHPDKHNGSKASTEVSQWLSEMDQIYRRNRRK